MVALSREQHHGKGVLARRHFSAGKSNKKSCAHEQPVATSLLPHCDCSKVG
jgi:hypothetical protein